jgi:hypothetical protein
MTRTLSPSSSSRSSSWFRLLVTLAVVLLGGFILWVVSAQGTAATGESPQGLKPGKVALKSIGALEMGPGGVLFAADSLGTAVYALDVGHPKPTAEPVERLEDVDGKIAALLGTRPRDIYIQDMAVDPDTGTSYLSILRGQGDQARPVLLRVLRDGTIEEVSLKDIRHSRLDLSDAPAEGEKMYRWNKRGLTVTDLEFIDGELFIAGLSNEEFESTLRRAPFPFDGEVKATGLEIYHGAHGAYETFAPIFSFVPYELEGKTQLLAGYLCTPLVTFPLDEVRTKSKLRGKTIAELGFGNIPTDFVAYEYEGEGYLVILNSTRGPMLIKASDLQKAQKRPGITTEVEPRTGVDYLTPRLRTAVQIADLDPENLMVLDRSPENGALQLHPFSKQWM